MTPLVLACHRGLGGTVRGMALVADDNFSARYDLDRERGIFSRPAHRLYGRSYVGRILVLKTAKGGVASAWMLRDMAARGLAPLALVFNTVNPILAQGAAFAGLALVDRFDAGDVTGLVGDGDEVEIAPRDGRLTILARASRNGEGPTPHEPPPSSRFLCAIGEHRRPALSRPLPDANFYGA